MHDNWVITFTSKVNIYRRIFTFSLWDFSIQLCVLCISCHSAANHWAFRWRHHWLKPVLIWHLSMVYDQIATTANYLLWRRSAPRGDSWDSSSHFPWGRRRWLYEMPCGAVPLVIDVEHLPLWWSHTLMNPSLQPEYVLTRIYNKVHS